MDRVWVWIVLVWIGGCQGPSEGSSEQAIGPLASRLKDLQGQVLLLQSENQALKRRLETADRPIESEIKTFYRLQSIRLTRYTGFYDKNKDGSKEKLIVYVQPVDEAGDVVKASGTVDVQLWDLSADPNRALVGAWQVVPQDLHKMWFATLVTINYRLMFDRPDGLSLDRPLTVKVVFTDGLTGRVLIQQTVIKPGEP